MCQGSDTIFQLSTTTTHSPFIIQSLKADEIINLDTEITEDPSLKGIEDISEDIMQLEDVRRSRLFKEMEERAKEYFDLIEAGKTSDNSPALKKIKARLDDIELEFSHNPVYVALMKSERSTELEK